MIQVQYGKPLKVLSEQELRSHLRVEDLEERDYLTALAEVSRERAEHYSGVQFGEREVVVTLDSFQEINFLNIGLHPVNEVVEISYLDKAGDSQVMNSYYLAKTYSSGCKLIPSYGEAFPEVQGGHGSVTITVKVGFKEVPESAKAAMKMIAANLYEHREDESLLRVMPITMSSRSLLDQFKVQVF